jgi:hypothetical protein
MTVLAAKLLIVGLPLTLSLAWCTFWMVRIIRERKRIRTRTPGGDKARPG